MSQPKTTPDLMEKIASLCKRRGFIFQSSEIYGGINGFWDYGPLGAELKRNVKELWWRSMTRLRDDIVGLDASIIMHPAIWKASGHVDTFSDPMVDCLLTKKRFRADQIEPQSGTVYHYLYAFPQSAFTELRKFGLGDSSIRAWIGASLVEDSQTEDALCQSFEDVIARQKGQLVADAVSKDDIKDAVRKWRAAIVVADFKVLVPNEKPPESGEATAKIFYASRGIENPVVVVSSKTRERVENTTRFNPENGAELTEPRNFNLMFKTFIGAMESEDNVAYLRPETAQAIFVQFKNVLETSRQRVPFGIAQIGKAFRNEINPRNFTFRSREFEQMELEFFIKPDEVIEAIHGAVANREPSAGADSQAANRDLGEPQSDWGWELWHAYWVEERVRFYESIGLSRETLVEYWQKPDELAHYARACVDILFKFPFSKRDEKGELTGEELEGIAARSDFDLSQHKRHSGKPMHVFDEELKAAWTKLDDANRERISQSYYNARFRYLTKMAVIDEEAARLAREDVEQLAKGNYIPHVIEPSAGVDRLLLALICNAYHEEITVGEDGKKQEQRIVMRFHPRVAPIKAGVFPLLKNKPELVAKAREVLELLRPHMNVFYDETGSIGRRYARQDEAGTPFGITIDFDTIGENGDALRDTVTLRHRDSQKQERVAISDLLGILLPQIQ